MPADSREIHPLPMTPTSHWAIESHERRYIVQAYLACISFVDAQVAKVVDALDAIPNAQPTFLVLWGEHGYYIGEKNRIGKHSVWNEAIKTPLIVAEPGIVVGNTQRTAVLIDPYQTRLDLCGLPTNAANDGRCLRTVLKNRDSADWPHLGCWPAPVASGSNCPGAISSRWLLAEGVRPCRAPPGTAAPRQVRGPDGRDDIADFACRLRIGKLDLWQRVDPDHQEVFPETDLEPGAMQLQCCFLDETREL